MMLSAKQVNTLMADREEGPDIPVKWGTEKRGHQRPISGYDVRLPNRDGRSLMVHQGETEWLQGEVF